MADAAARGAAALADLAARATALGGGLGGDENDVIPAARSPGSASDDEEEHGSQGADAGSEHGSVRPASSAGRRTPALAELPLVTDELAAIAASADSVLGPKLVTAIAKARGQRPLQRAYVKNLEVQDPDAGKWRRLRAYLGEDNAAVDVFRHLGGLLVHELVAEDPELDWQSGPHDPRSLLAALRELQAMASAIGASIGSALGSAHLPAPPKDDKVKKMTTKKVVELLAEFNRRPNKESVLLGHEIGNRTILTHLRECVLVDGVWPLDRQLSTDMMAPFADPAGLMNITDVPALEFNPAMGMLTDASRDPPAAPATSADDYLAKLRILIMSIAVLLHGVKCDRDPHLIPGEAGEDFCALSACNEFLGFAATLGKLDLSLLRSVVEVTLQDIAKAANARVGGRRISFTTALQVGLEKLRWRCEPYQLAHTAWAGRAAGSGSGAPAPAEAGKADSPQGSMADLKSVIAEAIASGLAGVGASDSRKRRRTERTDERRGREATYDVNGAPVTRKSRRGGWDDAPKCTSKACQKESWCPYSHTHMK